MNLVSEKYIFFFFNDTATTEIYTLSLHDALPICVDGAGRHDAEQPVLDDHEGDPEPERQPVLVEGDDADHHEEGEVRLDRSEEHTSELQSRQYLVCRLLLEKKKNTCHAYIFTRNI